jgi:tripeptide aminopeptidase
MKVLPLLMALVFEPSKVDPGLRTFELDPARQVDAAAIDAVDAERLAATLLTLLALPSKSCQEGPIVRGAEALLREAAGNTGITVFVDDVAERAAALPVEERESRWCNSGKTPPESGNLIVTLEGNPALPVWNLSFHLDTNQLRFDGFTRDGDIIRPAPGTPLGADDKAGLAIIAEVVRVLRARNIEHGPIRILGLVAEEDGAVGAQLVDGEHFRGDIVVSVDGGDPEEIGRAAPTAYGGYVTVRTQTSHPAEVHTKKSVSACAVGAEFLQRAGFTPAARPDPGRNIVLHSYFLSCGSDGGRVTPKGEPVADYQYNTISPFFTAAWQLRSLEGEEAARRTVQEIAGVLDAVCREASQGRTPVECAMTGTDRPGLTGYVVRSDAPSLRLLDAGFRRAGMTPRIEDEQYGGFNGNHVKARFGEEMLLIGTGGRDGHTNNETVSVSGMTRVARALLASMLESYRYVLKGH